MINLVKKKKGKTKWSDDKTNKEGEDMKKYCQIIQKKEEQKY